ncbi:MULTISPECIES: cupin domain-containing protein [Paraburkholderia]|uniref:cupin domain-containing protein n=1 Tax=Paraburkholderia TaxID=1822464 RepID=UPI000374FCFF|nr:MULTISPECIES: cupin domain-containing protein [Paraburkholderia]MDH6151388.1 quercetin dioxygenase-like cupin family protein [Paraburkholderia sp. WSM4179]
MNPVPTVVRAADLAAYAPANHTGTSNVRVIGPETVGATALEVLVGTIVKSHGARPHAHPHLEQCAYMIEGTGESGAEGRVEAMEPGTWAYVPAGVFHSFRVTSDQPGRVLIVYTPPYGENPAHTITEPDDAAAAPAHGKVRVLAAGDAATGTVPLIDRETDGARWVDIAALRMPAGSPSVCTAEPDVEQVLYVADGRIDARVDGQDFGLAPGDFLFLPRGVAASLRCLPEQPASGFLIRGRLPSTASNPVTTGDNS